jgi:DNA-binding MarR family transcriptional regulator
MDDVRWLDERERRAWLGLQLMNHKVDGELARRLHERSPLSYADYVVLATLTQVPERRMRITELGDVLNWEKSRISHQLTRMEKRGLIRKESCPTDRRGAFAVVTEAGFSEIEAAAPGHLRDVRELLVDLLSPEQLDALAEIAACVVDNFDRAARAESN